jgi:hypothetical protein
MPDPVAPSAPAAPAPSPSPAPAAPASPAPAPAAPVSPAPAPASTDLPSISDAWKSAVDSVPLGGGEPEPEPAPAAEPPAEEPPAEPVAEPEPGAEEPPAELAPDADLKLDLALEDTDFGPKELGDFLKKDVAVEKFFNDHPEVKSRVFAMARRDSETRAIREIVPTVALAQEMQRGHSLYTAVDNHFVNATTPEGFKGFMDHWVSEALIYDDQGQPVKENGQYKLHPALPYILDKLHAQRNDVLNAQMSESGKLPSALADSTLKVIDFLSKSADERVQEAAQILKEAISPSSSAQGELPDELKPFSESLKAKEKELNDRAAAEDRTRQASEQTARTEALTRADQTAAQVCVGQVKPLLKNAGLSEFEQKSALNLIGDRVDQKLKTITAYQIARDRLENGSIDAAREKEISKLTLTFTQEILGPIVRDVLRTATQGKLDRQSATDTRVADQQRASRTDARGASVSGSPQPPVSVAQIEDGLVKEYMDGHNGERPDRRWITEQMAQKMGLGGARRSA